MTFQSLYAEFEVMIVYNRKKIIMRAKQTYQGESVKHWDVRAGKKKMYFENNRSEMGAADSNRTIKRKLIKGVEYIKDPA
jgi:hypothetical protein